MIICGEDCCEICFTSDTEELTLIFCDICNSCFHIECAHLHESVVDQEKFICDYCLNNKPKCMLCQQSLPFHMFKLYDGFVHTLCYRFSGFPFEFESAQQETGVTQQDFIVKTTADFTCQRCNLPGLVFDCRKCENHYHPTCFILEHGSVQVIETQDQYLVKLLCAQHSEAMKTKQVRHNLQVLKNQQVFKQNQRMVCIQQRKEGINKTIELNQVQYSIFQAEKLQNLLIQPQKKNLVEVQHLKPLQEKIKSFYLQKEEVKIKTQLFDIPSLNPTQIQVSSENEVKKCLFKGFRVLAVLKCNLNYEIKFLSFDERFDQEILYYMGKSELIGINGYWILIQGFDVVGEVRYWR